MIFCILDRATSYIQVCKSFNALRENNLITRRGLEEAKESAIAYILKESGYRFPNQSAKFLKELSTNPINLKTATREELEKSIKGVGLKLASMFVRNTRGTKVAVLDTHIRSWLKERYGELPKNYYEQEKLFLRASLELKKDPGQLDIDIWEERRRKSKI